MIQMPRRSVTRFFIPLIDVLLLLFCIFLLMPQFKEDESKAQAAVVLADTVTSLEYEIDRLNQDMKKYEELRPALDELERLRVEIDQLRRERKQVVQRTLFEVIEIDGKTGSLYFYETKKPGQPKLSIDTEKDAVALMERHEKEAQGGEVYYYFLYPRPRGGYPTVAQERSYKAWFSRVPNSLERSR